MVGRELLSEKLSKHASSVGKSVGISAFRGSRESDDNTVNPAKKKREREREAQTESPCLTFERLPVHPQYHKPTVTAKSKE